MSPADHARLLDDARLLLDYAVRSGKLRDDKFAKAIEQFVSGKGESGVFDLQVQMTAVIASIEPMTLLDLRAGRNPFDERNVRLRNRWQVGLSIMTLFLIACIAYYQYEVQRAESALRAYKEIVEANGSEKVTEVRRLAQQGHALAKDSCQRESYQQARHKLKQLAESKVTATNSLLQVATSSPFPLVDGVQAYLHRDQANPNNGAGDSGAKGGTAQQSTQPGPFGGAASGSASQPGQSSKTEMAVSPQDEINRNPTSAGGVTDPCDEGQRAAIIPTGYPPWLKDVVSDTLDEFCLANRLNVDAFLSNDPIRGASAAIQGLGVEHPAVKVEQRLRVQTGWLLPFLGGFKTEVQHLANPVRCEDDDEIQATAA